MPDVIAQLVGKLGYEVDNTGLDKFTGGMDAADGKAKGFGKSIAATAGKVSKFAAAASAAAAVLLAKLVVSFGETGDEVAKTSVKLGVASDQLQRMRYGVQRSGADTRVLDDAIKKLNTGLVEIATKGTGPASEGFAALGLEAKDLAGLSVEEKFGQIADALQSVEDESTRSALAAKIFGETAGPGLKAYLDQGSAGMGAMGDRAEKLGGVLGKDALANAEAFQDGLLDLKTAAMGAGAGLVQGLTPHITKAADGIANWVAENDKFITQDLPAFLETVVELTGDVIVFFADAAASVDDFLMEVGHLVDDLERDLGPAIDTVVTVGNTLVDVWTDIASGIGRGMSKLMEFIGVLDSAGDSIHRIKVGLGIDGEKTTTTRGGQRFLGSDDSDANKANDARRARDQALAARKAQREADTRHLLAEEKKRDAAIENADRKRKQAEFAKRYAKLGAKGKGGKKRKDELDTSTAEGLFGSQLRDLAGLAGGSDKAIKAAIEASAKALEEGASNSVAFGAGVGRLESLTGASLQTDSMESALEGAILGLGSDIGGAGGGASPTAGAKFVRIDASFNAPTSVVVNLPPGSIAGMSANETMQVVERQIGDVLDERNRRGYDHFRRNVQA